MDLTKFVSLLDKEKLFFSRADKLNDPFEGLCPERVIRKWEKKFGIDYPEGFYKRLREFTAVNCWHLNEDESVAMWRLYLKNNEGIAIQSTFSRLRDSLGDENPDIRIGKVQYINYERYDKSEKIYTYPIMFKRNVFKHEQELRALVQKLPKRGLTPNSKHTFEDGIYVPVNLDTLIERIFVAPTTPSWQLNLVKSITMRYGLNKDVFPSRLDEVPVKE